MQTAKQEALEALQRLPGNVATEENDLPALRAGKYPPWPASCRRARILRIASYPHMQPPICTHPTLPRR